jgi:hypothetical protein
LRQGGSPYCGIVTDHYVFGVKLSVHISLRIALLVSLFAGQRTLSQNEPGTATSRAPSLTDASPSFESEPTTPSPAKLLDVDSVATIPFEENRESLEKLGAKEKATLAQQIRELPPGGPSNAKIAAFFKAWGAVEPKAALIKAAALKTQNARNVAVEAVINGMMPASAEEVVRTIKAMPPDALSPETKGRLIGLGMIKWSQAAPAEAAQFLSELYPDAATRLSKRGPVDGVLLKTTRAIAENWGGADPPAAMAWFQQHPDLELAGAMEGVSNGWWRKDPGAAAAYVSAHVDSARGRHLAAAVASRMAIINPRAAAEWVQWSEDPKLRRRAELEIAAIWASNDPKAASEWAARKLDAGRNPVIGLVAATWAALDPAAAGKWIDSLAGASRDAAIVSYSSALERRDPGTALGWTIKIADPKLRARNVDRIAGRWLMRQPLEARAWIQRSGLGAKEKARLTGQTPTPSRP